MAYLLRILNKKVVAVIAILLGLMHACPCGQSFNLSDLRWGFFWFIGAIFAWKDKTWAAILLVFLASYELMVCILPDIMTLEADVAASKNDFPNMTEATLYRFALTICLVGAIAVAYVICYGLKKVFMTLKEDFSCEH